MFHRGRPRRAIQGFLNVHSTSAAHAGSAAGHAGAFELGRREGWITVWHYIARPGAAAAARSRVTGKVSVLRRVLPALVVGSGLVLAGVPAVALAQASAPSACPAPAPGQVTCVAVAPVVGTAVTEAALQAAGTTPTGLSPANLQDAYSLPSATGGAGQTVAVVTAYDDATAETDMNTYRAQYGIAACSTGCFSKVDANGGTNYPSPGTAGWSLTDAEELDMISAVCPNCHIVLVEADQAQIPTTTTGGTTETGIGPAVDEAVTQGAKFVVTTVSGPEVSGETSWDTYFDHPGVAIAAPDGYGSGYGTSYPAASPDVIAVGGTTLDQPGTGTCTTGEAGTRDWCESAWPGTGSGCSAYEAKPSWQTDTGCTGRMLNDVSAVADPNTPVAVYYTPAGATSGEWAEDASTGTAAAIVAAAAALAGTPASDVNPAQYLYANAGGLNDITMGSNGTCSITYFCTAGPGYDGPTGLGTPDGVSAFLSSYYQPITSTRFLDTRNGTGGTTGPVKADGTVKLQIAGANGIPSPNVTAVAINLTATDESSSGDIVAYPDGTALPGTSNLNYAASTDVANLAIVPVGADGAIDLYNASGGTTQLVGDVSGYFTSDITAAGDTTYTPLTPTRVLDTRNGTGAAKAKLAGGGTLTLQIGGANGIPSGVAAVAINLTAADESGSGFLTAYADGTATPATSGLQFGTSAIAGMAIVPVGADGEIDIHNSGSSSTDVIGDVSGYFTAGIAGEAYRALPLTRLVDTRNSKAVAAGGTLAVTPGSLVVAPQQTLVANVTATGGSSGGDLIVYPAGTSRPGTSNLNYNEGQTIANLAIAATGDGTADIYNASSGTVQVIVDCSGYFSTG
jgi:hypothetical protein